MSTEVTYWVDFVSFMKQTQFQRLAFSNKVPNWGLQAELAETQLVHYRERFRSSNIHFCLNSEQRWHCPIFVFWENHLEKRCYPRRPIRQIIRSWTKEVWAPSLSTEQNYWTSISHNVSSTAISVHVNNSMKKGGKKNKETFNPDTSRKCKNQFEPIFKSFRLQGPNTTGSSLQIAPWLCNGLKFKTISAGHVAQNLLH